MMIALEVLIAVILVIAIVLSLAYFVLRSPLRKGYKAVVNQLEKETKVAAALRREEEETRELRERSLQQARVEVEEMSLHIGQKGDPNCP